MVCVSERKTKKKWFREIVGAKDVLELFNNNLSQFCFQNFNWREFSSEASQFNREINEFSIVNCAMQREYKKRAAEKYK